MSLPVLVCVDDDRYIYKTISALLLKDFAKGLKVATALNAHSALELIQGLLVQDISIPLVIVDYHLPDMGGDVLFR